MQYGRGLEADLTFKNGKTGSYSTVSSPGGDHIAVPAPTQATTPATEAQRQSEWADIAAKLAKLDAEATRRSAALSTVKALIAKLRQLTQESTKAAQREKQTTLVTADTVGEDRRGVDGRGTDGKATSGTTPAATSAGAVYPATLSLSQSDMLIDGKRVNLTPAWRSPPRSRPGSGASLGIC